MEGSPFGESPWRASVPVFLMNCLKHRLVAPGGGAARGDSSLLHIQRGQCASLKPSYSYGVSWTVGPNAVWQYTKQAGWGC